MMAGVALFLAVALLGLLTGLLLKRAGASVRRGRGLGEGETIGLDNVTLQSARLGLIGRPDRLIRQGDTVIVEEWKSGRRLRPSHCAQMGVYFLLVEDQWGVVPPHGFIVLGDGTRHQIDNSEKLRSWVLAMIGQIRLADTAIDRPIEVRPHAGLCRPCGMRGHCSQARG